MDLSSQSNSNYVNSNGIHNYGISNNMNTNLQLMNSNNIKSVLLTSPIHQLRVLHENKRSSGSIFSPSNNIASSTASFIATPMLIHPSFSNSRNNNGSSSSSSNVNNAPRYRNSETQTTSLFSQSPNSSSSNTVNSSSTNVNVNDASSNSSGLAGHDRVPCALTDDDRIPHNAQILADRYLILNQIAGSSFFECVDIRTGDALTCKAIGNCYSKILSAYFRMDGDPHIKPLHKLLQASDQTYLLLPQSLYGDLHSYVRERKRLRETEARHLFRQICKTVKSCHQQGIVLRDLKLRKFVFSDCDRTHLKFESLEDAVVLDDPDDDILKEKIGCPAYVAPEILKPNSDFSGKAADLWSLGVILYTMLVGRYPFNDPEHSSLFAKIARCQYTIPDILSSKARCLIKSLLQKVPKHRITSEDILYHPWLQENDNNNSIIYNNNNYNNRNNVNGNGNLLIDSNLSNNDDQRVPEIDCLELT